MHATHHQQFCGRSPVAEHNFRSFDRRHPKSPATLTFAAIDADVAEILESKIQQRERNELLAELDRLAEQNSDAQYWGVEFTARAARISEIRSVLRDLDDIAVIDQITEMGEL
jgi:hypothetical protein